MLDRVTATKGKGYELVCNFVRSGDRWRTKFICAQCKRGVLYVWPADDRAYWKSDRKRCRVCNAKFRLIEVRR